jgi:hypothetical protein
MKLRYLAFAGLLLASACASGTPEKVVFTARGGYDALLDGAATYSTLPRCESAGAPKVCSQQSVVDQMRKADAAAKATLDAAEDTVRNHPNLDASAAVAAANNAVVAYITVLDTYHIPHATVK